MSNLSLGGIEWRKLLRIGSFAMGDTAFTRSGQLGRRGGRIIEIEEVDTGERFHGSANRLEKLMQTLRRSTNDDHGLRYR